MGLARSLGEQESFSGRSLRQVSGKCYFAQQRLCGRCGGNNDCRLACNRRHAKELRKACGYRRLLSSTSMDEPEEEQEFCLVEGR